MEISSQFEQAVNQRVERAIGAAVLRQIVLESKVEELTRQLAETRATPDTNGKAMASQK